jgi:hypothetical protein
MLLAALPINIACQSSTKSLPPITICYISISYTETLLNAAHEETDRLDAGLLNTSDVLLIVVVKALFVYLLLDSVHGDVRNSGVSIEDTGDLLEGRSLGLRVDEVYPDELNGNPELDDC